MFVITLIFTIGMIVFAINNSEADSFGGFIIIAFIGFCVSCLFLTTIISHRHTATSIDRELFKVKQQVIDAIEDGAQDKERAVIRKEIFEVNNKLFEYQRDNDSWIWDLQTPDVVDAYNPIRMIGDCKDVK